MAEHPIQSLMQTAMENIREMVDVNTIIGDPVETQDGHVIIPVSKVGFGFAAGGSEFKGVEEDGSGRGSGSGQGKGPGEDSGGNKFPFGGGSGGGVSITPVAFIVVGDKGIRLLNMDGTTHLYDRIIDIAPSVFDQLKNLGRKKNKEDGCAELQ
ncbi:MAG: GerW family sporulation protein [Thermoactinomyces sp.]